MLTIPQVLRRPVIHDVLKSRVPASSCTGDTSLNKPPKCRQRPRTSPTGRRFESDLLSDQGESDHETFCRPSPLIRAHALEPLPPPIPSPPWSKVCQRTLILDDTPTTRDLDKHPCRYNLSSASKCTTRPFFKTHGTDEYPDEDSEHNSSSSSLKNARADAIALAQFRQIVEFRQVVDYSSSDTDPSSRVSTPEGYPEALRNRSKRPRSKSWDHPQLPPAKRQPPRVPTIVASRLGADSGIEMADPVQRDPPNIRPSPTSSCSFGNNDIQMNSSLASTASSNHISSPVVLSLPPVDRLDSERQTSDSSRRLHCSVPGCTASYHSLWAFNRHQANHEVSLPSPTVAMNCTKYGAGTKRFDSSDSCMNKGQSSGALLKVSYPSPKFGRKSSIKTEYTKARDLSTLLETPSICSAELMSVSFPPSSVESFVLTVIWKGYPRILEEDIANSGAIAYVCHVQFNPREFTIAIAHILPTKSH